MKFFVKLLVAAVVLAVILPFTVLKGKDGGPLMSLDDIKMPSLSLPDIPAGVTLPKLDALSDGKKDKDIVYKWRDASGELHFSSEPPPEGIEFTAKGYDPNMNLIQSVKAKPEKVEVVAEQSVPKKAADIGSPYSPGRVDKLMKDAQNIEKLLTDRQLKQEAALGQ